MKTVLRNFSLIFVLGLAGPLMAGPPPALPQTLNYQGRLRLNGGGPVADSTGNTLVFRLYTQASGGSDIWNETWDSGTSNVTTQDGLFNVVLGTYNPLTLPFNQQYWLGVEANSDGEMIPRQPLTMAPYAFRARDLALPLSQAVDLGGQPGVDVNNTSASAAAIGVRGTANNGHGVEGLGNIGVYGTATSGGTGIEANQGAGSLALRVQGPSLFNGPPTFSSGANFNSGTVDFTGATTLGLPAAGEVNTASNRGAGAGIFSLKSGMDLQFKSLVNSNGTLTLSNNADEVTLDVNNSQALWNANRIQGRTISGGAPVLGDSLIYNGVIWIPGLSNSQSLQGTFVSAGAPSSGQVLTYNSGSSQWVPSYPAGPSAPLSLTSTTTESALNAANTAGGAAFYASNSGAMPTGSFVNGGGEALQIQGTAVGLSAVASNGIAIYGVNNGGGGFVPTAQFLAQGTNHAVEGRNTSNGALGVLGGEDFNGQTGVYGLATANSAKGVFGRSGQGTGVRGEGLVGVAGVVTSTGQTGVLADGGGISGSQALHVIGNSDFINGSVSFTSHVDFSGATVTNFPSQSLVAPVSLSGTGAYDTIYAFNSNAAGNGLEGKVSTSFGAGHGVIGRNVGFNNTGAGVFGTNSASSGYGVLATNSSAGASPVALSAAAASNSGTGIYAQGATGVRALASAPGGSALLGDWNGQSNSYALKVSGPARFDMGSVTFVSHVDFSGATITGWNLQSMVVAPLSLTLASATAAPLFLNNNGGGTALSVTANGTGFNSAAIHSEATAAGGVGLYSKGEMAVYAEATTSYGVYASNAANGGISAVYGQNNGIGVNPVGIRAQAGNSGTSIGVLGVATNAAVTYPGTNVGVMGYAQNGSGVRGVADNANAYGVSGHNTITSSNGYGVLGTITSTNSNGAGVVGSTTVGFPAPGASTAVYGFNNVATGIGVLGVGNTGTGGSFQGLTGVAASGTSVGISATASNGNGIALFASAPIAISSSGSVQFNGVGRSVSFGTHVDFSSATVTGWNVPANVVAPLNLGANAAQFVLSVTNTGNGEAIRAWAYGTGPAVSATSMSNDALLGYAQGNGAYAGVRGIAGDLANFGVAGDASGANKLAGIYGTVGAAAFPVIPGNGTSGVVGATNIANGTGVAGVATCAGCVGVWASGDLAGVSATAAAPGGAAVFGTAAGSLARGVVGYSTGNGPAAAGVYAKNTGASARALVADGNGIGISATASNASGIALFASAPIAISSNGSVQFNGVGKSVSFGTHVDFSAATVTGWNVPAIVLAPLNLTNAAAASTVFSNNTNNSGVGVYAKATGAAAKALVVEGFATGISVTVSGGTGTAVFARTSSSFDTFDVGNAGNGNGVGASSTNGSGVFGLNSSLSTAEAGVKGRNTGSGTGVYGFTGSNGLGVRGEGQTGTAGTAIFAGGLGVLADWGGTAGSLALKVSGPARFDMGSVTFVSHVDFSGATVTGWNMPVVVTAPLNLTLNSGVLAPFSASNLGAGPGVSATSASGLGLIAQGGATGALALGSASAITVVGLSATANNSNFGGTSSIGLYGNAVGAPSVNKFGVYGEGGAGTGVYGNGASGVIGNGTTGVRGTGTTYGVYGDGGSNYGVWGQSSGGGATLGGVYGNNTSSGPGVYGTSSSGYGVYGSVNLNGEGVRGEAGNANPAIHGVNFSNGAGVFGQSNNGIGTVGQAAGGGTYGVEGKSFAGGFAGVHAWDLSGLTTSAGLYGQSGNGIGVRGTGQTGTAGTASLGGGIGVLASDGGMAGGALALRVMGNALFSPGSVTFASYVDFSGATVTGLSVPLSLPLSATANAAGPAAVIRVANAGTGFGLQGIATKPGLFGTGFLDSTFTAGVYGVSSASISAGVLGLSVDPSPNNGAIIGLSLNGTGVMGQSYGPGGNGGKFQADSGTALVAQGLNGINASANFTSGTAIRATTNGASDRLALDVSGPAKFTSVGGSPTSQVDFFSDVAFHGNVTGLPGGVSSVPLVLTGAIGSPILQVSNTNSGGGDGASIASLNGYGLNLTGNYVGLNVSATSGSSNAIYAQNNSNLGTVLANNAGSGPAFRGQASGTGLDLNVVALSTGTAATGVAANISSAAAFTQAMGTNISVNSSGANSSAFGHYVVANATGGGGASGLFASAMSSSNSAVGVHGEAHSSSFNYGAGLYGSADTAFAYGADVTNPAGVGLRAYGGTYSIEIDSNMNANNNFIRNLQYPVFSSDAANKQYVDDHAVSNPLALSGTSGGAIISGTNSNGAGGYGLYGAASGVSNTATGVYAANNSPFGYALQAVNASIANGATGIYASGTTAITAAGTNVGLSVTATNGAGAGIFVLNTGAAGNGNAILAYDSSSTGVAIAGANSATSGNSVGVLGQTNSNAGFGVAGFTPGGNTYAGIGAGTYGYSGNASQAGVLGNAPSFVGVYGQGQQGVVAAGASVGLSATASSATTGIAVYARGKNTQSSSGTLFSQNDASGGQVSAIFGLTSSGIGVVGTNSSSPTLPATSAGIAGYNTSGYGVWGKSTGGASGQPGVWGENTSGSFPIGVVGSTIASPAFPAAAIGVIGFAPAGGAGVVGKINGYGSFSQGIYGTVNGNSTTVDGSAGIAASNNNVSATNGSPAVALDIDGAISMNTTRTDRSAGFINVPLSAGSNTVGFANGTATISSPSIRSTNCLVYLSVVDNNYSNDTVVMARVQTLTPGNANILVTALWSKNTPPGGFSVTVNYLIINTR